MTSIISVISGQFSKSLILGTLLPVMVFSILGAVVLKPLLPNEWHRLLAVNLTETQWVLGFSFLVLLLTGLLYNLNIPLIRLYEGYSWEKSLLGRLLADRHKARLKAAQARWAGMRTLAYSLGEYEGEGAAALSQYDDAVTELWIDAGDSLSNKLPPEARLVLPTRLGNVIRCFESYPDRQYQLAGITIWPRLVAKIDKDYALAIDNAKVSFDFMLNCSLLSATLALVVLVAGLLYPLVFISAHLYVPWLACVVGFAAASYLFYIWSIGRASSWGTTVRSAFDLYRGDLLKQLGFKQSPSGLDEERRLWNDISDQLVYGDSPRLRPARYVSQTTAAQGDPGYVVLEVTRGVRKAEGAAAIQIFLKVRNNDPKGREVKNVVVEDVGLAGHEYEWDSFECDREGAAVSGTETYKFVVGDLKADEEAVLSYRVVPYGKPPAKAAGPAT